MNYESSCYKRRNQDFDGVEAQSFGDEAEPKLTPAWLRH